MTYYYANSTGGFYSSNVHETMPQDAVEISDATRQTLLSEQAQGKSIGSDEHGNPVVVDRVAPRLTVAQQIQALEIQQTPRRIREAALGQDNGWLKNIDNEIAALRQQLPHGS